MSSDQGECFFWGLCKPVIASTDLWPQDLEMFTFLVMLAMVVSESSFGAYVRPWGLHRHQDFCKVFITKVVLSIPQLNRPMTCKKDLTKEERQSQRESQALSLAVKIKQKKKELARPGSSSWPLDQRKSKAIGANSIGLSLTFVATTGVGDSVSQARFYFFRGSRCASTRSWRSTTLELRGYVLWCHSDLLSHYGANGDQVGFYQVISTRHSCCCQGNLLCRV